MVLALYRDRERRACFLQRGGDYAFFLEAGMTYPILGVISGFVVTAVWLGVMLALDAYWRMREPQVVECPSVALPAAVALVGVEDARRVVRCSRWPLHRGCSQACVAAESVSACETA